jgi:hypothetical protein
MPASPLPVSAALPLIRRPPRGLQFCGFPRNFMDSKLARLANPCYKVRIAGRPKSRKQQSSETKGYREQNNDSGRC